MRTDERKGSKAVLMFQLMPILIALVGIMIKFNSVDFIYLMLILVIFTKYLVITKK